MYCDHRHRNVREHHQAGHHHCTARRDPPTPCALQTASGETPPPHLDGIFHKTDSGAALLKFCVFVANITDEFIMGLDAVPAHDSWI